MELSQFDYLLPKSLIARYPARYRSESRLLQIGAGIDNYRNLYFSDLAECLHPGDLLVLNNTRVLPARLSAHKPTGGKVEILLERLINSNEALVQCSTSKKLKLGQILEITGNYCLEVVARQAKFFVLKLLQSDNIEHIFMTYGEIPLPPYLDRSVEEIDNQRYQTVYARQLGAVAAPTAGLHFDSSLLAVLKKAKIAITEITLHIGAGTFKPVRDTIDQHLMHPEYYTVNQQAYDAIEKAKKNGGRIVAVGTTTVRALESAALSGELTAKKGDTQLFITPGFEFKVVDALVTNFHLPRTTLLMMVSAFAGHRRVMNAYHYACRQRYRFYSYGDAMFLTRS